jgi:hypothetical protein
MDDLDRYKSLLEARIKQFLKRVEDGDATEEYVAFEVFVSLFDAANNGIEHSDICDAYPTPSWRDETVTIPKVITQCIFDGWMRYRETDSSVTVGNAFNLEGRSQGKSPIHKINKTKDAEIRRANAVVIQKLRAKQSGEEFDLDSTYFEVADREFSLTGNRIKPDTVKKAYLKHGAAVEQKYQDKHREVSDLRS